MTREEAAVAAWEGLVPALAAVESRVARALRRFGLGPSEFRALARLSASASNEVRLFDLAEALGLDRSSVSRLVTRLEGAELVRRDSCGDDRRGVFIVLTDAGRALHQAAHESYARTLVEALDAELPAPTLAALTAAQG